MTYAGRHLGFLLIDEGPTRGGYAVMEDNPSIELHYEPGEDVCAKITDWWLENGTALTTQKLSELDETLNTFRDDDLISERAA